MAHAVSSGRHTGQAGPDNRNSWAIELGITIGRRGRRSKDEVQYILQEGVKNDERMGEKTPEELFGLLAHAHLAAI